MKESTKTILLFLGLILVLIFAPSCTKQETIHQSVCNGNCDATHIVVYKNQEILPNINGHYEIDWDGLNYFQIKGLLTPLNDQYVINGIPLVETRYDSDYWVVFDSLQFQTPMFSYLGWFTDQGLNTPITIGPYVYTMNNLLNLHPPYNIAGYQLPKHWCTECPAAQSYVGSYSKYNYEPTQNFLLDDEMVGDTINVFIETVFNIEQGIQYHGHSAPVPGETLETQIKVIVI
jgi:hypothetical protein